MFIKNKKFKIKTPNGWEPFHGLFIDKHKKQGIYIKTVNKSIKVSNYHLIQLPNKLFIQARFLTIGQYILTESGPEQIIELEQICLEKSYEIIKTDSGEVITNGIYNHNCDEFAFVKPTVQERFWTSISPTLSTGGSCLIASTPNGDSNKFADIWFTSQALTKENNLTAEDYVPMQINWDDVPGRDEQFKNAIIKKDGLNHWLQEYVCKFISSDNLLIDTNKLDVLNESVSAPFFTSKKHKIQFWSSFKPNKQYIVGVDPATGTSKDFSVISIFEFPSLEQIALYRSDSIISADLYVILTDLLKAIEASGGVSYVSVENNGVGEGMISLYLKDEHFPVTAKFINENQKKYGFVTTTKSKWTSCLLLKDMIEHDDIIIHSPITLKELKTFIRKGASYCAQAGSTDDCISSLLIVLRILEKMTNFDTLAFNKMYTNRHARATSVVSMTKNDLNVVLPHMNQ